MSRPSVLVKDKTLYWTIRIYDENQILVDADLNPIVQVRKNGQTTSLSTTVTRRSGVLGTYDCSLDPSGEVEGDYYTITETALVSTQDYVNEWSVSVVDPERGTDGANTVAPDNAGISANGTAISNLNDFNPATDTVANVTTVQTTVSNSDMRGTDNALLAADAPNNFDILFINGSGQVDATGGGGGSAPTEAEIYTYFTSASREDAFKADTTGLSTFNSTTDQVVASNMRGTDNALLAASAPANWSIMLINGSGEITTSNPASGGGSAHTAEDVRDLILAGDKTPIATTTGSVNNVVLVDTTTDLTNSTGGDDASTIYSYFTTSNRQLTFRADTSGLSTFNHITDQVVASNMRGTDGANTIAPDNAGISANGVAIAALNDFDPANDVVANVTLVDTTTNLTNSGSGSSTPRAF